MATIELERITKVYDNGFVAVDDVSLSIADGEFIVLVGPSGCGKSTLLRTVAGLEEATAGEVRIDGVDVTDLAPRRRDIAMVFQSYALYPHMSVRENMAYGLKVRRAPKAETRRRVEEVAGMLGLTELLDRRPAQLSGGQRQRVAMGRAIVRDPQVFLFDEPLSNLDAKLRVQMRTEIKELHQRLRTTSIYVTHDQIEAMTMADRIVVMRDGLVEQSGDPLALYDAPVNTFVAAFIGSPAMNLVPGVVRMNGSTSGVEFEGGVRLPMPRESSGIDGQPVLYGMRPEHCVVTQSGGLPAEVVVVEPTGADTQLFCRFNGQEITSLVRDRVSCRAGDRVGLSPDVARAHLFDAKSGARLAPKA